MSTPNNNWAVCSTDLLGVMSNPQLAARTIVAVLATSNENSWLEFTHTTNNAPDSNIG